MPSKAFDTFPYGLDTRRSILTSQPGVLAVLNNGHVNQGAEIEKRKAFIASVLPTGTFGLESLLNNMVTFGSEADPGGLPSNVVYQQLQHPDGTTAMTGVVCSSTFGNAAAVLATFADGRTFLFYNGVLVRDYTAGLILPTLAGNNVAIAADLVSLVNATSGYTAVQRANPFDNSLDIFSAVNTTFSVATTVSSAAGTITVTPINTGIPGVAGVAATGGFTIVAGTTGSVTQVNVNGTNLLSGGTAIPWNTNTAQTASDIVNSINNNGASALTATANGAVIQLTEKVVGTTQNGYVVQVVATGDICIGSCVITFALTAGHTTASPTASYITINGTNLFSQTLTWGNTYYGVTITTLPKLVQVMALDAAANSGANGGFTASFVNNNLFISALTTNSTDQATTVTVNAIASLSTTTTGGTPLVITMNPTFVDLRAGAVDQGRNSWVAFANSGTVSVSVTGGAYPYTYRWSFTSGGTFLTIANPTAAGTTFSYHQSSNANFAVNVSATAVCTVTDSLGAVTIGPSLPISVHN